MFCYQCEQTLHGTGCMHHSGRVRQEASCRLPAQGAGCLLVLGAGWLVVLVLVGTEWL